MKKNIMSKRILCTGRFALALALALTMTLPTLSAPTAVSAEDKVTNATAAPGAEKPAAALPKKSEIIYASLDEQGAAQGLYAVNAYDLTEKQSVKDYGDYSQIKLLTGEGAALTKQGQEIDITAPAGRLYYQGDLSNRALPWIIHISWQLNGQAIDAAQLSGASGDLNIHIDVTPNQAADPVFASHYALQAGLTFDPDHVSDITAKDGTIANTGKSIQVNYMLLPNTEGHYQVDCRVKDFRMDGISFGGVALNLVFDKPDMSEMTNGLKELEDGIRALSDGGVKLSQQAGQIDSGASTLADSGQALSEGAERLTLGLKSLAGGSADLRDGFSAYRDGINRLSQAAGQLSGGMGKFGDGLDELAADGGKLNDGAAGLAAALGQITAQLPEGGGDAQLAELKKLSEGSAAFRQGLDDRGKKSYASIDDGIQKLVKDNEQQLERLSQLAQGLRQIQEGMSDFQGGLTSYTGGVATLSANFNGKENTDGLRPGAAALAAGLQKADGSSAALADGLNQLHDGALSALDGSGKLSSGVASYSSGIRSFSAGLRQYVDGVGQLTAGNSRLALDTKGLSKEARDRIDAAMKKYDWGSFVPRSFVSAQNKQIKEVQFVLLTKGIPEKAKPAKAEQQQKPKSFWEKIKALFGAE